MPKQHLQKRKICLTVDYEIFGNGSGDVRRHIIEPTERMCRIAEKFGMPVTIFFELEEYLLFERHRDDLKKRLSYDPADEMKRQAADLVRRGHDIQLHLHPQWHGAGYEEGEWQLHHHRLTVDSLFDNQAETTQFIKERKAALECISGNSVTCYRAGGFAAQPGGRLLNALAECGFVLESSVVKGMHRQKPHPLDYRTAPEGLRAWKISSDVACEDKNGTLWEVPVHATMGRRFQQLTFKRLKAKFSRHVPKARQQEMMDHLGVRKTIPGIASFLLQPVPIKLDFHNLSPAVLMRMIRRAPFIAEDNVDALVLIGHTKEHTDDVAFEDFLSRVSHDKSLEVVSMARLAEALQPSESCHSSVSGNEEKPALPPANV